MTHTEQEWVRVAMVVHNCLFWSVGAINYGMSEKCNDCCKE